MEAAEITSTCTPALDSIGLPTSEKGLEALDFFTLESLDLFIALIPSVAIWARGALPTTTLADRVRTFSGTSLDVYIAPVREPIVSGNPFSERKTLICSEDIDDLTLKRTLFGLERHEEMIQRVILISAICFAGCIATFGSAPLLAACAYAPLHCIAKAYTHDTAFLDAFPEEKDALIKKREQELQPPAAFPTTPQEYASNAFFYANLYVSAALKRDVVERYEVFVEPEIEPEFPAQEAQEQEPVQEPVEELTPEPEIEPEPPAQEAQAQEPVQEPVEEPTPEPEVEPELPAQEVQEQEPVQEPVQKPKPPKEAAVDTKSSNKRGGHRGR